MTQPSNARVRECIDALIGYLARQSYHAHPDRFDFDRFDYLVDAVTEAVDALREGRRLSSRISVRAQERIDALKAEGRELPPRLKKLDDRYNEEEA